MKRYLERLALWLFVSYCFCGCARPHVKRDSPQWGICKQACESVGGQGHVLAEDDESVSCVCKKIIVQDPPAGT